MVYIKILAAIVVLSVLAGCNRKSSVSVSKEIKRDSVRLIKDTTIVVKSDRVDTSIIVNMIEQGVPVVVRGDRMELEIIKTKYNELLASCRTDPVVVRVRDTFNCVQFSESIYRTEKKVTAKLPKWVWKWFSVMAIIIILNIVYVIYRLRRFLIV